MEGSVEALKEHYGIKLSSTVINKVTRQVGKAAKEFNAAAPSSDNPAPVLVVEIDGSMVPIVKYGNVSEEQKRSGEKRDRNCFWKEFRLCTVSEPNEAQTRYGVTDGSPLEAGCMMYQTCQYKGMDGDTHIHGVGDGAPWIAEQYEEQFGVNHQFYIDFYHVSEYLGAASKELTAIESVEADWYEQQREKLRESKTSEVLSELAEKNQHHGDQEAVESCLRYLGNRVEHLDYATALEQKLPIGSGEVESGHRSVLQKRLKKPGAWWVKENAETMAQLKTLQSNGHWEKLWQKIAA
jgi:hypothetical protein